MELSAKHIEQYRREGYTVARQLIAPAETVQVRQRLMELLEGDHDWPEAHFQVLDPNGFSNAKGGYVPIGVQRPAQQEDVFSTIADHENLQRAMSQLLGGPVVRYTDQALIKYRHIDGNSFYHQDSYYWKIEPERGCNAWIALDEFGARGSALAIMPDSHRDWQLIEHERYYDEPTFHSAQSGEAFTRWRIPREK